MSNLESKVYWICFLAGIMMLAVLGNLLSEQEHTREEEIRTGTMITASIANHLPAQRLRFMANQGQAGAEAKYHVQGAGHTVLFYQNSIGFRRTESADERNEIVLQFEGANPAPVVEGVEPLPGVAHFYKGSDPNQWHANVPTYGAVLYKDLYPGIDMAYAGDQGALKSEFYLSSGADYHQIRLNYRDSKSRSIRDDGALVIETALGTLVEKAPVAYQQIGGVRNAVEAAYVLLAEEAVGFVLGHYDRGYPLVIDPELVFITTIDNIASSWANDVTFDGDGNIIMAGAANRFFPATDMIEGSNHVGGLSSDGLLVKVDGTSGEVIYSALLGGSRLDYFRDFAIDAAGTMYLTGLTASKDFPVLNAVQDSLAGKENAFVVILSAAGELTYSTYLGGSERDWGESLAIDGNGNIFVAGRTESADLPFVNGFQQQYNGGESGSGFPSDNFIAKFNAGGGVDYVTYLGGSGDDAVCGMAVNASGEVTVANSTGSTDFPLANAYQQTFAGGESDLAVTRLNSDGGGLLYSTYFGGTDVDACSEIILGSDGDVFVSGTTVSEDFPVIGGDSFPEPDSSDGILLMFDAAGQPVYSVRSNSPGFDRFDELDVDHTNTAFPVSSYGDTVRVFQKSQSGSLKTAFDFAGPGFSISSVRLQGHNMALAGIDFGTNGNVQEAQPRGGREQVPKQVESGGDPLIVKLTGLLPAELALIAEQVEKARKSYCPPETHPSSFALLRPTQLNPGDRITAKGDFPFEEEIPTARQTYLSLLQCVPDIQYGQEGAIVLIDADQPPGGPEPEIYEINAPLFLNDLPMWGSYIEREKSPDRVDPNSSTIIEIQDDNTIEESETTPAATPRVCAILVMGEPNGEAETEAFETDQAIFKANLMGEKLGPRLDANSIIELKSPSKQEIIDTIKETKDKYDEIYFFYSGHGYKAGLAISKEETLTYTELSRELYGTNAPKLRVVIDACHSGASIRRFQGDSRFKERDVTVVTAAAADKRGYGQNQLDEDGEVVQWGLSFGYWLMKGFGNPDADTNKDGSTSIKESFEWMRGENPVIKKTGIFSFEGEMNEVSDPQILTNESKKPTSKKITFPGANVEVSQNVDLNPESDLTVAMVSGLGGDDREDASVTALSSGRHWVIDAVGQTAPFAMDITFRYDPALDFELTDGAIPGLAVRPIQDLGSGKTAVDPWQAYLPTVWDPDTQTITALGVSVFQEWAIGLTVGAQAVSIEEDEVVPIEFGIKRSYPNPFNQATRIAYDLSEYSDVRVTVYDAMGRVVRVLVEKEQASGRHEVIWDGRNESGASVASGTYLARLETKHGIDARLLTRVK